jgi:hypothetical protein
MWLMTGVVNETCVVKKCVWDKRTRAKEKEV